MFYLLIVIYALVAIVNINDNTTKRTKLLNCVLLLLPLFLIVALRDNTIGPDTMQYYKIYYITKYYRSFTEALASSRLEPGYLLVTYIFSKLGFSYYFFQFIISLFIYYSFGRFIYQNSSNAPLSCFLLLSSGCVFGTMNVIRMWISVAILLYSVKYLKNFNIIKFVLIVILAALFHYSALIFLIIYPICKMKLTNGKLVVAIIISIALSLFAFELFSLLTEIVGIYQNYLTQDRFDMSNNSAVKFELLLNIFLFLLIYFEASWKDRKTSTVLNEEKNNSINRVAYVAMFLTLLLSIVGLSNNIMGRISWFFSIFLVIAIPRAISNSSLTTNKKILLSLVLVVMSLEYVAILMFRPEWYMVMPYKTFLL